MKLIREYYNLKLYLIENQDAVGSIGGQSAKVSLGLSCFPSLGHCQVTRKGVHILSIDPIVRDGKLYYRSDRSILIKNNDEVDEVFNRAVSLNKIKSTLIREGVDHGSTSSEVVKLTTKPLRCNRNLLLGF